MKIFLDDFIIYSDMKTHLQKFKLSFYKCMEYKINLNPKKCTFMVFSGVIMGFIISKEGKLLNLKKIQAIVNMDVPQNSLQNQIFNGMAQYYKHFIKNFVAIMVLIIKFTRKIKNVATLALDSRPKQGLAKVQIKYEALESHFMLPGV